MDDFIVLLDPSIADNHSSISNNLGDCIIYNSVKKIIINLFPETEIRRVSLHSTLGSNESKLISKARYSFVGGSNILTSNICDTNFTRFLPKKNLFKLLNPPFSNVILLGTGWCVYQNRPNLITRNYYQKTLNKNYFHSVRDNYSKTRLQQASIKKIINTGCPTLWEVPSNTNDFNPKLNRILFTLTDYDRNPITDNALIEQIMGTGTAEIFFFPQGVHDIQYIQTLSAFKTNKSKIKLLKHDLDSFYELINNTKLNFIGTRLHAGIACLQKQHPTLIISIDNRATEMKNDFNLPVIKRTSLDSIKNWLEGGISFMSMKIPHADIDIWKNQFKYFN